MRSSVAICLASLETRGPAHGQQQGGSRQGYAAARRGAGARRPYATIDADGHRGRGQGPRRRRRSRPNRLRLQPADRGKPQPSPSEPQRRPPAPPALPMRRRQGRGGARHRCGRVAAPPRSYASGVRRRRRRSSCSSLAQLLHARPAAGPQSPEVDDLTRRLADIEACSARAPNSRPALPGRGDGALARRARRRRRRKLARDTKALESKVGSGQEIPRS